MIKRAPDETDSDRVEASVGPPRVFPEAFSRYGA